MPPTVMGRADENFAKSLRRDFPILHQEVHGKPLIYLDNAATTHKPQVVIDAMRHFYEHDNSNVHRGVHELSQRATIAFETARDTAARFLNARDASEIIFTRGTTESINLIAHTWGAQNLKQGDQILLTEMEHHSNIVPWQILANKAGAKLVYVPVTPEGSLDLEAFEKMLTPTVKLASFTHISNTLGTINPVSEMCRVAREHGVISVVDAAQSAGHRPLDVQEMECDFLALSGHKMCGPMGIGVLYGRRELLANMPPFHGGGDMISRVGFFESCWKEPPHRFEAGTPNVAGAVGLAAAMQYLEQIGRDKIEQHDLHLSQYAYQKLELMEGINLIGPKRNRAGLISFLLDGIHAHDVVTIADQYGIALRGGHHCNQPLMEKLGVESTVRASFYIYNETREIDELAKVIAEIQKLFLS